MCLESQQARWAKECNQGGDCPICNPQEGHNEMRHVVTWSIALEYNDGTIRFLNNEVPDEVADAIESWLDKEEVC